MVQKRKATVLLRIATGKNSSSTTPTFNSDVFYLREGEYVVGIEEAMEGEKSR